MKYRLMVSKGFMAVSWNDDVMVEAKDEDEAHTIALKMAEDGKLDNGGLSYYDMNDSDANYQVEWCEEFKD